MNATYDECCMLERQTRHDVYVQMIGQIMTNDLKFWCTMTLNVDIEDTINSCVMINYVQHNHLYLSKNSLTAIQQLLEVI